MATTEETTAPPGYEIVASPRIVNDDDDMLATVQRVWQKQDHDIVTRYQTKQKELKKKLEQQIEALRLEHQERIRQLHQEQDQELQELQQQRQDAINKLLCPNRTEDQQHWLIRYLFS